MAAGKFLREANFRYVSLNDVNKEWEKSTVTLLLLLQQRVPSADRARATYIIQLLSQYTQPAVAWLS